MKLINPKVEIIPQDDCYDAASIYKQIEIAGRTCYKSEDKYTGIPALAKTFVDKMIANKHTAMLEHGSVYLTIPIEDWNEDEHEFDFMFPIGCPWVKWNCDGKNVYISTNFRHIVEGGVGYEIMDKYISKPTEFHTPRVTVRFTCDRGVSHELVRHRVFSFAQESTRYCNYSKDKFGNQLTFIIPSWMDLNEGEYQRTLNEKHIPEITGDGYFFDASNGFDDTALFLYYLSLCEQDYFALLEKGWKPQQARQVLPNALKTEVVMTGFVSDWMHFFDLRTASTAHPDMQKVANDLFKQFVDNKYI